MPSLILLSGLLSDETIWAGVAARLSGMAEITILAFPGYRSIAAMAEQVLRAAPARFALAGHSMGGRVALEVVRQDAHRVERLALLNTGVHAMRDDEPMSRSRLVNLARERGMAALADEWLPPMMGAVSSRTAMVLPLLKTMVERETPESFAAQVHALLNRPDAESVLSSIRVPTLLLSGTADRWSPLAQHEAIQRQISGARLAAIEGAGHMALVEDPDAVAAALRSWMDAA